MEEDWGLQAVVRGCSSSSSSTTNTTASSCCMDVLSSLSRIQSVKDNLCFPDLFEQTSGSFIQELHDLSKPFFPRPQQVIPISRLSVFGALHNQSQQVQQQQQQHQKQQLLLAQQKQIQAKPFFSGSRNNMSGPSTTNTPTSRSKRRKNQMKRVCQVPAEDLSSDMWSWRKYGQKPIKGSPYPRGYYRCSTSKGCLARKQVERNRSDPAMFIVTYTGEHNHPIPTHRNSLAGSTRQKPVTSGDTMKPTFSPPISPAASLSPPTEKIGSREERKDEDDELLGVSDMGVSDDFFEGLEELAGPTCADCFPEQFTSLLTFPWMGNSATTAAAHGG